MSILSKSAGSIWSNLANAESMSTGLTTGAAAAGLRAARFGVVGVTGAAGAAAGGGAYC